MVRIEEDNKTNYANLSYTIYAHISIIFFEELFMKVLAVQRIDIGLIFHNPILY